MPSPFAHHGRQLQLRVRHGERRRQRSRRDQRAARRQRRGMLLGAGLWWIRPGANVLAGVRAEVLRRLLAERLARDVKLTLNLGLRWEVQPGPTERYDRMSAWDFDREERRSARSARCVPRRRRLQPQPLGHDRTTTGARASAPPISWTTRPSCAAASASRICRATPATSRGRPTTAQPISPAACSRSRTALNPRACRSASSRTRRRFAARRRQPGRSAGLRHRRSALRPALQERPARAVELLHRAASGADWTASVGYSAS